MIELRNISVRFGQRSVLEELSLEVASGQLVCLVGPSGCGKSTILNAIAGLTPFTGEIQLPAGPMGYAFQEDRLIPWRSASQNLRFALVDRFGAEEAARRTLMWIDRLGLESVADQFPATLSGGMRRRVNLARALACEPAVLLLDEPFAFLDPDMVGNVQEAILSVARESRTTTVVVSHVLEHINGLSGKVYRISGTPISALASA